MQSLGPGFLLCCHPWTAGRSVKNADVFLRIASEKTIDTAVLGLGTKRREGERSYLSFRDDTAQNWMRYVPDWSGSIGVDLVLE